MKRMKLFAAAVAAVCLIITGCAKEQPEPTETTTAAKPDFSVTTAEQTEAAEEENITIYTGKEVENEEDHAIYKFNCTVPEGFKTAVDDNTGKGFISPNASIVVKAQNYKEEFQDLEVFADSGCASLKVGNMLYQADTEFADPVKTTIAGYEAIKYDYTVTSYIYPPVTDADGQYVLDDDDQYVLSEEKEVYGEFVNRIYFFFSDEDAFYIICEASKEDADSLQEVFDQFIESISISK